MGTHNALLRLGERVYLEIIAIDPDGATPPRPRWFDLDDVALQARADRAAAADPLGRAHARTSSARAAACPIALGAIHPMARGDFRWRITIPDDGRRPGARHRADADPMGRAGRIRPTGCPPSNVSIAELAATHPDPAPVRAALAALGLADVLHVTYDRETRLCAMLRTPRGIVTL